MFNGYMISMPNKHLNRNLNKNKTPFPKNRDCKRFKHTPDAVSYTHLDVYKRQHQY